MQIPVEYAIDGGPAVLREARTTMASAATLGLDTFKYLWRFSDASTSVGPGDVLCSDLSAYVPQTCTLSSEVSLGGGADGNQSTVQVITAMARIAASWRVAPLTRLARQAAPSDLLLQRAIVALASGNNSAASTAAASTGALDGATKLGYWLEQFRDVMSEAPGKVRSLAVLSSVLDEALHTCSATILELSREEPLALGASCDGDECPVWTSPPDWTVATLHATHPWLESAQVGARYGGGWEVTILTVDLQFTLHGSLRCPMSPALNVKLQVRQEAAALRFYRYCLHDSQCGDGFDTDAAAAAAARLSVDGVGIVRMGVANASLPGHVWWHDYEALQLRRDRITPEAVCAQLGGGNSGDANSVVVEVRLEFDESLPLIAPAVVPLPLSVALGGVRPASPLPVHVAPMVVCSVACAASSHTLVQLPSEAVSWNLSDDVPHKLVPCLDGLLSDYARCGRSKAVSDAAFARCVGGGPADMLAVPGWWLNRSSTIEGSIEPRHFSRWQSLSEASLRRPTPWLDFSRAASTLTCRGRAARAAAAAALISPGCWLRAKACCLPLLACAASLTPSACTTTRGRKTGQRTCWQSRIGCAPLATLANGRQTLSAITRPVHFCAHPLACMLSSSLAMTSLALARLVVISVPFPPSGVHACFQTCLVHKA